MTASESVNVKRITERLRERRDDLEVQIAEIDEDLRAAHRITRLAAMTSDATSTVIVGVSASDLTDCDSQRAALRRIAELNEGLVHAREAATLLIEAGLSRGKLSSAVSSAHGVMSTSEEWEWIEPSVFRHHDYSPSDELGTISHAGGSSAQDSLRQTVREPP